MKFATSLLLASLSAYAAQACTVTGSSGLYMNVHENNMQTRCGNVTIPVPMATDCDSANAIALTVLAKNLELGCITPCIDLTDTVNTPVPVCTVKDATRPNGNPYQLRHIAMTWDCCAAEATETTTTTTTSPTTTTIKTTADATDAPCDESEQSKICRSEGREFNPDTCDCVGPCADDTESFYAMKKRCQFRGLTVDPDTCECADKPCDEEDMSLTCKLAGLEFDFENCKCTRPANDHPCGTFEHAVLMKRKCEADKLLFNPTTCECRHPIFTDPCANVKCWEPKCEEGFQLMILPDQCCPQCVRDPHYEPPCDRLTMYKMCAEEQLDFNPITCDCIKPVEEPCNTLVMLRMCSLEKLDFDKESCSCKDRTGIDYTGAPHQTLVPIDYITKVPIDSTNPPPCPFSLEMQCREEGLMINTATCSCKDTVDPDTTTQKPNTGGSTLTHTDTPCADSTLVTETHTGQYHEVFSHNDTQTECQDVTVTLAQALTCEAAKQSLYNFHTELMALGCNEACGGGDIPHYTATCEENIYSKQNGVDYYKRKITPSWQCCAEGSDEVEVTTTASPMSTGIVTEDPYTTAPGCNSFLMTVKCKRAGLALDVDTCDCVEVPCESDEMRDKCKMLQMGFDADKCKCVPRFTTDPCATVMCALPLCGAGFQAVTLPGQCCPQCVAQDEEPCVVADSGMVAMSVFGRDMKTECHVGDTVTTLLIPAAKTCEQATANAFRVLKQKIKHGCVKGCDGDFAMAPASHCRELDNGQFDVRFKWECCAADGSDDGDVPCDKEQMVMECRKNLLLFDADECKCKPKVVVLDPCANVKCAAPTCLEGETLVMPSEDACCPVCVTTNDAPCVQTYGGGWSMNVHKNAGWTTNCNHQSVITVQPAASCGEAKVSALMVFAQIQLEGCLMQCAEGSQLDNTVTCTEEDRTYANGNPYSLFNVHVDFQCCETHTAPTPAPCDEEAMEDKCAANGLLFDPETCHCVRDTAAPCEERLVQRQCERLKLDFDADECDCVKGDDATPCDEATTMKMCKAKGLGFDAESCSCAGPMEQPCEAELMREKCHANGFEFDLEKCSCIRWFDHDGCDEEAMIEKCTANNLGFNPETCHCQKEADTPCNTALVTRQCRQSLMTFSEESCDCFCDNDKAAEMCAAKQLGFDEESCTCFRDDVSDPTEEPTDGPTEAPCDVNGMTEKCVDNGLEFNPNTCSCIRIVIDQPCNEQEMAKKCAANGLTLDPNTCHCIKVDTAPCEEELVRRQCKRAFLMFNPDTCDCVKPTDDFCDYDFMKEKCAANDFDFDQEKCECIRPVVDEPCDLERMLEKCAINDMDFDKVNCDCVERPTEPPCDEIAMERKCKSAGFGFDPTRCNCIRVIVEPPCDEDMMSEKCAANGLSFIEEKCACGLALEVPCPEELMMIRCKRAMLLFDPDTCDCRKPIVEPECNVEAMTDKCESAGLTLNPDLCECEKQDTPCASEQIYNEIKQKCRYNHMDFDAEKCECVERPCEYEAMADKCKSAGLFFDKEKCDCTRHTSPCVSEVIYAATKRKCLASGLDFDPLACKCLDRPCDYELMHTKCKRAGLAFNKTSCECVKHTTPCATEAIYDATKRKCLSAGYGFDPESCHCTKPIIEPTEDPEPTVIVNPNPCASVLCAIPTCRFGFSLQTLFGACCPQCVPDEVEAPCEEIVKGTFSMDVHHGREASLRDLFEQGKELAEQAEEQHMSIPCGDISFPVPAANSCAEAEVIALIALRVQQQQGCLAACEKGTKLKPHTECVERKVEGPDGEWNLVRKINVGYQCCAAEDDVVPTEPVPTVPVGDLPCLETADHSWHMNVHETPGMSTVCNGERIYVDDATTCPAATESALKVLGALHEHGCMTKCADDEDMIVTSNCNKDDRTRRNGNPFTVREMSVKYQCCTKRVVVATDAPTELATAAPCTVPKSSTAVMNVHPTDMQTYCRKEAPEEDVKIPVPAAKTCADAQVVAEGVFQTMNDEGCIVPCAAGETQVPEYTCTEVADKYANGQSYVKRRMDVKWTCCEEADKFEPAMPLSGAGTAAPTMLLAAVLSAVALVLA